jgi:hypothetical protein
LTELIENELRAKTIPIKRLKRRLPVPHAALERMIELIRAGDMDHTLQFFYLLALCRLPSST